MRNKLYSSFLLSCTLTAPTYAWNEPPVSNEYYDGQSLFLKYNYQPDYQALSGSNNANDINKEVDPLFSVNSINTIPMHLSAAPEQNWDYLLEQSYTILGLSLAMVGMMTLLPESVTNWDEEDRNLSNLGSKWWDNVSQGPVWDNDDHYLNYIMHPYFGGVYYTAARHSGFDEWESFLYSATMSTFFYEYGVEAFAEVPSIQDIIVTPLFGAAVGELMFQTELDITANGGEVLGSETLGEVSLFFLNPVGHIHYWVSDWWHGDTDVSFTYTPWFGNANAANFALEAGAPYDKQFIGLQLKLALN
ncbi:DUF3943 domain-containing protein [Photobacterium lipolyticum]|uniref:DUF3943 domain-containing protein n=1 Tax=Photobacterium lipolyticum TaxID=266810 RepID=A0A2T3N4K5_9GAMM|nr:DUF3943 domain-containing protein [Photobacterium lipolyticum]PSW07353.1 DUF3943 domain-containing protein [Photobacterium lipolyticum]